ncbi:MAG: YgaP-like transmembrane domain [Bryobacteraceae bacterium]|jgi:uncharacterized membrane protein
MQILQHIHQTKNVGKVERAASVMAGTLLIARGLRKKGWLGTGAALLGIAFVRRGVTGFCYPYQALGINSNEASGGRNVSVPSESGIRIEEAITINRPRDEVYRFWRDLSNLAHLMQNVESVSASGDGNRSHWIAKGPGGKRMEWDTEIVNESENELIAWRSLDGSEVPNAGSVYFKDAAGGRGTEIKLELQYLPPGGAVGGFVARLFGEDPAQQIHNDLKRLKARIESGVVPETAGQPVGGRARRVEPCPNSDAVGKASEESFPASDAPAYTR